MPNFLRKTIATNPRVLVCFGLICLALYGVILSAPFKTLDDQYSIVANTDIQSFQNIGRIFSASFFGDKAYYRPFVSLSFMTEYHFFGAQPIYYYLTNILIHAIAAFVVFLIVIKILQKRHLAFFAALLFLIHPIHWEAVSNISGRAILLAAFFNFVSFYYFLMARERHQSKDYLFSLLFFGFALLCKESAVMLPIVICAYLFWIEGALEDKTKTRFLTVVPFFVVIGGYVLLRKFFGITHLLQGENLAVHLLGVISFLKGFLIYLRIFIIPFDLHFDRSIEFLSSYHHPHVWGVIIFYVAAAGFLVKFHRKISFLVKFLLFWYVVEFFPVSQIVSSVGVQPGYISLAEHFLYVPSVPFFMLIVLGVERVYQILTKRKIAFVNGLNFLIIGALMILSYITIQLNVSSSSERLMFERSLKFSSHNSRIGNSLALSYALQKDFKNAEYYFRQVLKTSPWDAAARISLGKTLIEQGKIWDGIFEYEKVTDPKAHQKLLENNIASAYQILENQYLALLEKDGPSPIVYYSLGVVYSKTKRVEESITMYQKTLELDPLHKNARFNLGLMLQSQGSFLEAKTIFESLLLQLTPSDEFYQPVQEILNQLK